MTISQSGETADTLAALRNARHAEYLSTLAFAMLRKAPWCGNRTRAADASGTEIGVASTKAFTTQLTALAMLTIALAKNGRGAARERELVSQLLQLPGAGGEDARAR